MKKIYLSLFSLFTVLSINAQLTQTNHAPAAGDTYETYQCDTVSPGSAGANQVWNFSTITTHSSIVKSFTTQATTNSNYPASNVTKASSLNDVSYLASSATALEYYGGNILVGPVAGSLDYTSGAVYAAYPMSLNTTSTSVIAGSVNVTAPLQTTGTFTGNSSTVADGTGTINLPGGLTYSNTMRVVTGQTMNITTAFASAVVTMVNYEYYASGIKAPVFSIATATAVIFGTPSTQTIVTRIKDAVVTPTSPVGVGISENSVKVNFSAFPNPASGFINFVTDSPEAKSVALYDITGKLVTEQNLIEGKTKVDVSSYNKGLYFYTISSANNKALKTGKITVGQ